MGAASAHALRFSERHDRKRYRQAILACARYLLNQENQGNLTGERLSITLASCRTDKVHSSTQ
ncbi:hypothetical protein KSC_080850 [Ktedonobacter sp. SOSP1-52]|nr:hypothetical protein KSC_080850 [Ktedonobacter sp. SOSP1-52]